MNINPYKDFSGYHTKKRNHITGLHNIISDCKKAEEQGDPIVHNYKDEGGRWQVLCVKHGGVIYVGDLLTAKELIKDPTSFCTDCADECSTQILLDCSE